MSKYFKNEPELISWANSKDGTDYIITIIHEGLEKWILFYIK